MGFGAGFKDKELVQFKTVGAPLRLAASRAITGAVHHLDMELQKTVKTKFFFKGNVLNLRELSFEKSGKYGTGSKIFSATLAYKYKAVPMSEYPINLVETGYTNKTAKNVFVKIRKGGTAKLVRGKSATNTDYQAGGKIPYMGFAQNGMIFERNQRPTWKNGHRLAIHALYSPSFTDLLQSPELENYFASSKPLQIIEDILKRELNL